MNAHQRLTALPKRELQNRDRDPVQSIVPEEPDDGSLDFGDKVRGRGQSDQPVPQHGGNQLVYDENSRPVGQHSEQSCPATQASGDFFLQLLPVRRPGFLSRAKMDSQVEEAGPAPGERPELLREGVHLPLTDQESRTLGPVDPGRRRRRVHGLALSHPRQVSRVREHEEHVISVRRQDHLDARPAQSQS